MRRIYRSVAVLILGVALTYACGSPPQTAGASPSSQPPSSSPTSQPSLAPSATPASTFACKDTVGGSVTDSTVVQVAVGQHAGYDRFVITFGGGIPSYKVTNQKSASFQSGGGKGGIDVLAGNAGVLITVHSIDDWATYSGPTEFLPRYPFLREARQTQNYEGYQSWALGIQNGGCIRFLTLASPNRLVVDIGAPS